MSMRIDLLLALLRTLATRGASFRALEAAGVALSCTLDVPVTLVRRPGSLTCFAGDRGAGRRRFVRVRQASRVRSVAGLGTVRFDGVSPLAHAVAAGVLSSLVCTVGLDVPVAGVLLAFVVMLVVGTVHVLVRHFARRIMPEGVFA